MTAPRPARPDPGPTQPRLRPSDERAHLAESARTTRRIAWIAVVAAVVALGLAAWRFIAPADSACQDVAWNTTPKADDLPPGWSVSASQYDVDRKQMTVVGPAPADAGTAQAVVYATVTCFPSGAADAVTRSADAATAAGQTVTARDDLGDQAFSATDPSNATFLQLRHGNVVVYLAASGDATASEVDAMASAFDKALGGDGGRVAVGTPDVRSSSGSPSDGGEVPSDGEVASVSPAAPALEAAIPDTVGDITLGKNSATGADVLGDDLGARAVVAALREAGHEPVDLLVAYASDESGSTDLAITGLAVDGMGEKALRELVLTSWLPTGGAGVTKAAATVGGRGVTKVDYGDGGPVDYVLATPDGVFIVTTGDRDLAAEALRALP
jgi:hypothetical protein